MDRCASVRSPLFVAAFCLGVATAQRKTFIDWRGLNRA